MRSPTGSTFISLQRFSCSIRETFVMPWTSNGIDHGDMTVDRESSNVETSINMTISNEKGGKQ